MCALKIHAVWLPTVFIFGKIWSLMFEVWDFRFWKELGHLLTKNPKPQISKSKISNRKLQDWPKAITVGSHNADKPACHNVQLCGWHSLQNICQRIIYTLARILQLIRCCTATVPDRLEVSTIILLFGTMQGTMRWKFIWLSAPLTEVKLWRDVSRICLGSWTFYHPRWF